MTNRLRNMYCSCHVCALRSNCTTNIHVMDQHMLYSNEMTAPNTLLVIVTLDFYFSKKIARHQKKSLVLVLPALHFRNSYS